MDVIVHPVCRNIKGRDARLLLNSSADRLKIHSCDIGNRRIRDRYKLRRVNTGRLCNIMDQTVITSHDGIHLVQPGKKDQAVVIIPANFIMRIIGRITAGGVMHDDHASQFKKRAADAGDVTGINRYFSENLSHIFSPCCLGSKFILHHLFFIIYSSSRVSHDFSRGIRAQKRETCFIPLSITAHRCTRSPCGAQASGYLFHVRKHPPSAQPASRSR